MGGRRIPRWVWWLVSAKLIAVVLFVVLVGVAVLGMLGGGRASFGNRAGACPATSTPGAAPVAVTGNAAGLTAEQLRNAQAIAGVALGLGLGEQGVLIGIVTAITESALVNVDYGDTMANGLMSSSRGLFQQLDAWGPLADRLDPVKSATMFYTDGKAGQRGLMQVPGWQQMTVAAASQAVQGSQFASGSNYQSNLAQARAITMALMAGRPASPAVTAAPVTGPTAVTIGPLAPASLPAACGTTTAAGGPAGAVPVNNVITDGVTITLPPAAGITGTITAPNHTAAKAIAAGLSQLGVRYSWGAGAANGPTLGTQQGCYGLCLTYQDWTVTGYDCAGLMLYSWAQAGVSAPRGSQQQAFQGVSVPYAQRLPGDMLGAPGHITMYVGVFNGTDYWLEAPQSGGHVQISPVGSDHYPTLARIWQGLP